MFHALNVTMSNLLSEGKGLAWKVPFTHKFGFKAIRLLRTRRGCFWRFRVVKKQKTISTTTTAWAFGHQSEDTAIRTLFCLQPG
jgi:hypothetical protein